MPEHLTGHRRRGSSTGAKQGDRQIAWKQQEDEHEVETSM